MLSAAAGCSVLSAAAGCSASVGCSPPSACSVSASSLFASFFPPQEVKLNAEINRIANARVKLDLSFFIVFDD